MGEDFLLTEKALHEEFLMDIFLGMEYRMPVRDVTIITVKNDRIALPDPTLTAHENWMASYIVTTHFIEALQGWVEFRSGYHAQKLRDGNTDIRRYKTHNVAYELVAVTGALPTIDAH